MTRRALSTIFALTLALAVFAGAQDQQQQSQQPQQQPASRTVTKQPAQTNTEHPVGTRTKREVAQKGPQQAATQGQPWKKIAIPPLPAFHPKHPKRIQLPNGMVLFLQEDHELPLIDLTLRIRGGSRLESAGKVGLVSLYGSVWRTGGTKDKTGDQLDDFLEARAAKVETGGGVDSTSIGLNCLKQDFDDVFAILMDLLKNPAFREDKLDLAKRRMDTVISRRNDDISSIAGREAAVIAYGRDNPYARYPEYSTVAAVTQQDLMSWHENYVHPNNIILGVDGDFDATQMEQKLRQAFADWPKGPPVEPPQMTFHPPKPGYYFVPKSDVNQSDIEMVGLGIERKNPDYFALTVMNEVLGGGFSSRLFKNVREAKGLAYAVGGGVGSAFDHPGIMGFSIGTKTSTTAESVEALYKEIDDMSSLPVTADELKSAKDAILNTFVFRFDSPDKVLAEQMAYEFYGYPSDFLEQYRAKVEKITGDDVHRVAQKYLHKNELAVLVVGQPEVKDQVAKLGPVTTLDISIPPSNGQPAAGAQAANENKAEPAAAKPTSSNAEGKALIAKVAQAMGGAAKLQTIKALREKGTMQLNTPAGPQDVESEKLVVFPDRLMSTMQTPQGEIHVVVTPQNAFMHAPAMNAVRDLPGSVRDDTLNEIKRDEIYVAQHANDPRFIFNADGTEEIGDVEATVLHINADGAEATWWVDPSGHVVRERYTTVEMTGPVERTVDRSDFRATNGITLAMKRVALDNQKPTASTQVKEIEFNPTVAPNAFVKPAGAKEPGGSDDE
jgi:zinc protease